MAKYPHVEVPEKAVNIPDKKKSKVKVLSSLPKRADGCPLLKKEELKKKMEEKKEKRALKKAEKKAEKKSLLRKLIGLFVGQIVYIAFHSPKKARQKRREIGSL